MSSFLPDKAGSIGASNRQTCLKILDGQDAAALIGVKAPITGAQERGRHGEEEDTKLNI